MNIHKIFSLCALCLPLCFYTESCTTYDYDEELNDAEQQRIRLHQEDQKIYDKITAAAQSLDHLIGEMSARVRGELGDKETVLLQDIAQSEALVRQYLDDKIGDADAYVDQLDQQSRQIIQQKEGEFDQARNILQQQMLDLAQQGYNENAQKMQEGIDLLDNFQSQYNNATGNMRDRINALKEIETRLANLEQQVVQIQQRRAQILQRVTQLQSKLQTSILAAVSSAKTREEHTAALREMQTSYADLVKAMNLLDKSFVYDDSWVNEAESSVQTVQGAIGEIEDAIKKVNELNALLEQFEAGKADAILQDVIQICDNMQTLADYDPPMLDEAQTASSELQTICDEIYAAMNDCVAACQRCEDAYNDCDWESWKS